MLTLPGISPPLYIPLFRCPSLSLSVSLIHAHAPSVVLLPLCSLPADTVCKVHQPFLLLPAVPTAAASCLRCPYQQLQQLCQQFSQQPQPNLQYPAYYTVPFHSYDDGNLNWQAAFEVEPASYAMALRTFKTEPLTGEHAMLKLRGGINDQIQVGLRVLGGAGDTGLTSWGLRGKRKQKLHGLLRLWNA